MERLDKILAHHGFGSRKDCKKLLRSGSVLVNGKTCTLPETQIDTENDCISVGGELLQVKTHVYIMLNKCRDVVTSTKDGLHRTVLDLLDQKYRRNFLGGNIHPVGRLDIDTEGLLILTTDGELTHRLTSPKTHVPKKYFVRLHIWVDSEEQERLSNVFKSGMQVIAEGNEESFVAQSASLEWRNSDGSGKSNEVFITISEGKYHQVKRMFATVGNEVEYLKRISMGNLVLDETLLPGEYRELTGEEVLLIKS